MKLNEKLISVRMYHETYELLKDIRKGYDLPYRAMSITQFLHYWIKEKQYSD